MARGSVREVRPGVFRLRWDQGAEPRTGERRQGSATVRGRKRDADQELARRLAAAVPEAPARLTLAAFLVEWLETSRPTLAPTTVASYEVQVGHLTETLGKVPLARLTARQVQQHYSRELEGGLAPSSVGVQHAVLRRALRQARRWKLVPFAVTDDVEPPRIRRPEPRALSVAELQRLLEAAEGSPLRLPIRLACLTTLRRGEVLGLWWSDLDWSQSTLAIRRQVRRTKAGLEYGPPKSQAGQRSLCLSPGALTDLREHQAAQEAARRACPEWTERGLIFPDFDGELWHPDTFSGQFRRLASRAGLPPCGFHALRHASITLAHALGIPARVIQARAGHASAAMTAHYTHLLDGQDQDAAARLEAALNGPL